MNKLIPKYQSPWAPINYKPPENSKEVRVTNKQETHKPRSKEWNYHTKYNPIYTVGDTLEKTPEYKLEINPQTGRPYTVQEKDLHLSGTDPVGEFIVAGEVLGGLNPLGKILFPYAARFTSGSVRNWIASKALNDVLAKDALTGGVNKVVLNNGNILLQLASHSSRKPRQLRIEPQGNNAFRVHASTWGGLTDIEKKLLYEALYKELPENAKILFPESNPDYLATRGTVAGLLRLKRDPRFTPGSTLLKLMYKDKDGSIKFFEGTSFTKNSELQPKAIFRTVGYKGGDIKDKYSAFFTTDPRYAKQYGKVQKYLIESDNFNVAGEPLIGTRDPVGMDMFIYQNTRSNPNSKLIIGHDVVTDEFPYLSKGTEMLSLSPNNYTSIQVNKPKTSLAFFENPSKNTVNITPEQWTAAQDAAIARGDMVEAQRLRDLHFKISAPNTKTDVPLWTSSEEAFNSFDLSHFGETDSGFFGYGHYLTPIEKYAASYHPVNRKFYVNMENPYIGSNDQYFNRIQYVKDRLARRKEIVMRNLRNGKLTNFSKKLGINENTSLEDAEHLVDKYIADETVKWNNKYVKYADEFEGKDGVFSWREIQGIPNKQEGIYREVVVPKGEQIKSADAVTYDDNGVRIPLGKRDNFNVNDIRYGLVPWLIGGTTAGYLYNNKQ